MKPADIKILFNLENGFSSAGSRSIARPMMYRCAANPHADADEGTSNAVSSATATTEPFRMLVY